MAGIGKFERDEEALIVPQPVCFVVQYAHIRPWPKRRQNPVSTGRDRFGLGRLVDCVGVPARLN